MPNPIIPVFLRLIRSPDRGSAPLAETRPSPAALRLASLMLLCAQRGAEPARRAARSRPRTGRREHVC